MEGPPYPKAQPNASRRDAYPPEGGPQGSSLSFMQKQHLDPHNVALGVLNPLATGQGLRNQDLARCDLLGDQRLADREMDQPGCAPEGLRSSSPTRTVVAAATEIRKRAGDRNFVQVLLLSRNVEPLGQRRYWPIYRGRARRPGFRSASTRSASAATRSRRRAGRASTSRRWSAIRSASRPRWRSLVLEGVFERFPKLKMVMIEAGFGWAPSLAWRLDKVFERLHSEVPHLKRKPSEYIRDHIWWTTQPMEDPERREHLFQVIEWIGWDKLLFATDYPHWDYDEPSRVLPAGVSATPTGRHSISTTRRSSTASPDGSSCQKSCIYLKYIESCYKTSSVRVGKQARRAGRQALAIIHAALLAGRGEQAAFLAELAALLAAQARRRRGRLSEQCRKRHHQSAHPFPSVDR